MNKAFVREPEPDGRAFCPRCGSLGTSVDEATLDHHVQQHSRPRMGDSAWFCDSARCGVAYFDLFERFVAIDELQRAVYPKDAAAPICACFGFTLEDIEADVADGTPTRIRELLAKSNTSDAHCHTLAANGQCCMREVQRLYMRRIAEAGE
ncbi:MAG: hypothetical protein HOK71_04170 [Planctomycetaceae bacterium]|jgi:hypothetical protein|nr:hypothetical protein [Planctomycetaceae bacterium]